MKSQRNALLDELRWLRGGSDTLDGTPWEEVPAARLADVVNEIFLVDYDGLFGPFTEGQVREATWTLGWHDRKEEDRC